MGYRLEGDLLEVCNCRVLCPCWIGEDPDFGTCEGTLAWKIEKGDINGVDVSGLSICILAHIPGNILKGNWKAVVYIDDNASEEQEKATPQSESMKSYVRLAIGDGSPSFATTVPVTPEPTMITSFSVAWSVNALKIQCVPSGLAYSVRKGTRGDRNSSPETPGTCAVAWPGRLV